MRRFTFLLFATLLPFTGRAAESRLTNVSVRSSAGSGDDTLIVGFTIGGFGNKQLLLRGVGPTLSTLNVPGAVSDPELRVFDSANALLTANDDWGGSSTLTTASDSVGAFRLPANSRDAALLLSLPTGSYSAHLLAKSGPGVALVEGYDTDAATSPAQIRNISTRSTAGTGANVLTIGFSITGDTARTVLIRAVGPSLAGFGVEGALTNPQLRLFSSRNTELGFNDDWLTTAGWSSIFTDVGAFSLLNNTRDSALLVRLQPGTYTAQATGAGGASGVALIEVYDMNPPRSGVFVFQPVENTVPPGYPVSPSNRVTFPSVLTQARPVYPFELRVAGAMGEALIQFVVGADGRVSNAIALRSHDVRLAESALTAVRQWTFAPARNVIGEPVLTVMQVPIIFTLND